MRFIVSQKILWSLLALLLVITSLGIGLGIGIKRGPGERFNGHSGSVVSNGHECAAIGGRILQELHGTAADAAIATLFCEGVAVPQSCGLGGGFILTIYTKSTGKVETLNAREVAPKAATEDMFLGQSSVDGIRLVGRIETSGFWFDYSSRMCEYETSIQLYGKAMIMDNGKLSILNYFRSVAVPGELKGIWELYLRYGSLPWRTLIQPSIDLCRNGHVVSRYFADVLKMRESTIRSEVSLAEVFINPDTNAVWIEGDKISRPKLAETLQLIADEGADTLYNNGTLAQMLVADMQEMGGLITVEDFMDYNVRWEDALSTTFLEKTIHTVPLPGSGSVLILILNVLNGFLPFERNLTFYQRFVECFKFAYAKRTELADPFYSPEAIETFQKMLDPDFASEIRSKIDDNRTYQDYAHYGANFSIPDDNGTAHISVIAPNGDAIALTTTINSILGSKVRSRTTGIILNDQMDDFSTPGVVNGFGVPSSPANYIVPGKRPLSSMCPSIVVDANGDVKLVIGSAGGTRITTTVAYIIISQLMFGDTLSKAVDESHFHYQLAPMYVDYEIGFNETILQGLIGIGHKVYTEATTYGFVAVTAIAREGEEFKPVYDQRRHGSTFVF